MEGNIDALADRLAQRSESRLTGGDDEDVGSDLELADVSVETVASEVERLRMASPFCQGREDSYFSPQDVEIVKDVDEKVKYCLNFFDLTVQPPIYLGDCL